MKSKLIALLAALAVAALLASCGDAEQTTTTEAPATTAATEATAEETTTTETTAPTDEPEDGSDAGDSADSDSTLTIIANDELRFDPDKIELEAGQEIELTFDNVGSVQHSLAVLNADSELDHVLTETDEEHLHDELHFDIHAQDGGSSVTETFTAPSEPGSYVFACLVPGHAEAGMVGTLVVR